MCQLLAENVAVVLPKVVLFSNASFTFIADFQAFAELLLACTAKKQPTGIAGRKMIVDIIKYQLHSAKVVRRILDESVCANEVLSDARTPKRNLVGLVCRQSQ